MYPLLFSKVLKEKVWGGREFEEFLNLRLKPGVTYGESWEVSAHPSGPSMVTQGPWQGRSLPELVLDRPDLLGAVEPRYQKKFPLLIKYLDIHDRLSVQVHPEDSYALAHEGEWGKSECWYVLKASPDARLILGLAPGIDRETFRKKSQTRSWEGLFQEVSVHEGDFIPIPPGTVHASLQGSLFICEVQQNSDTTYRIYDFDRLDNGVLRPLHLEQALEVIQFDQQPRPIPRHERRATNVRGAAWETLAEDPHYRVAHLAFDGEWEDPALDVFHIHSVLAGKGTVQSSLGEWPVNAGQTWLIPAQVHTVWTGNLKMLRSWV
ncbi:MAG: class I mannose-6-phosphate isomerase [Spirochaetales bacterium]|nr:class I mannose-6-phosphate isomerase [Spirochaetales bacterium]